MKSLTINTTSRYLIKQKTIQAKRHVRKQSCTFIIKQLKYKQ